MSGTCLHALAVWPSPWADAFPAGYLSWKTDDCCHCSSNELCLILICYGDITLRTSSLWIINGFRVIINTTICWEIISSSRYSTTKTLLLTNEESRFSLFMSRRLCEKFPGHRLQRLQRKSSFSICLFFITLNQGRPHDHCFWFDHVPDK